MEGRGTVRAAAPSEVGLAEAAAPGLLTWSEIRCELPTSKSSGSGVGRHWLADAPALHNYLASISLLREAQLQAELRKGAGRRRSDLSVTVAMSGVLSPRQPRIAARMPLRRRHGPDDDGVAATLFQRVAPAVVNRRVARRFVSALSRRPARGPAAAMPGPGRRERGSPAGTMTLVR